MQVQPVGAFVKTVDDAWYLPKTVGSAPKLCNSGSEFWNECKVFVGGEVDKIEGKEKPKGSVSSVGSSFLQLVYDTAKFVGALFASAKFLGKSGVTALTSRVKTLGLYKNVLSTYCAVHDLVKNYKAWIDTSLTEGKDKAKKMALRSLAVLGCLSSLCLNGFGALQTIYGSGLSKVGKTVMPPFGWNTFSLVGTTGVLLGNTIKKLA